MKLASAERIVSIVPIDGADQIVKATVLGWDIVVKKDEFKPGDLVSYIQIDTIVPETLDFEFLRARDFRVRTIKLRKQISQGLVIPLPSGRFKEGDDLTEVLGVKKFTKSEGITKQRIVPTHKKWHRRVWQRFLFKYVFKFFPALEDKLYPPTRKEFPTNLVSKTDEERIQNIPGVLDKYRGKDFIVSEKLDGSSITLINDKGGIRVCSRNNEILSKDDEWYKVYQETNFASHIATLIEHFRTYNIIVQGEYIGKPQGNKYKLFKNEIRLFNIIVNNKRIPQDEFYNVCWKYSIPCAPFLAKLVLNTTLTEIIKYAEGKSVLCKETEREGVVFRCVEDNLSFKVISNKFLLKNDE